MTATMTTRSLPGDTISLRARLALGALLLLLLAAPTIEPMPPITTTANTTMKMSEPIRWLT